MTPSLKSIRLARRLLLGTSVVATAVAAVVVEENIRGNHAWHQMQAQYAARHELLHPLPPALPVADEQNVFKAPVWAELVSESTPPAQFARAQAAAGLYEINRVHALTVLPLNLAEARQQMVKVGLIPKDSTESDARAVLTGMQPVVPLLDGVGRAVRERPRGAAPAKTVWAGSDLRFGTLYNIAKLLTARAQARIGAGNPQGAYEDTLTVLQVARACEFKPETLMHVLVATAIAGQAANNLKLANADHAWTDEQLAHLQQAFGELHLVTEYEAALHYELAWQLQFLEQLPQLSAAEKQRLQCPWWMIPGWMQQNKVSLCRSNEEVVATVAAFGTHDFGRRLSQLQQSRSPYTHFARLVNPNLSGILRPFASDINALRAAETALALERHYRQHGQYPATLGQLTRMAVTALPVQADGTPVKYTVAADGSTFTLEPIAFGTQGSESRKWVQGAAAAHTPLTAATSESELDGRREIRRKSDANTEQP